MLSKEVCKACISKSVDWTADDETRWTVFHDVVCPCHYDLGIQDSDRYCNIYHIAPKHCSYKQEHFLKHTEELKGYDKSLVDLYNLFKGNPTSYLPKIHKLLENELWVDKIKEYYKENTNEAVYLLLLLINIATKQNKDIDKGVKDILASDWISFLHFYVIGHSLAKTRDKYNRYLLGDKRLQEKVKVLKNSERDYKVFQCNLWLSYEGAEVLKRKM